MSYRKIISFTCIIFLSFFYVGCSSNDGTTILSTPEDAMVGFFIDGPVQGLQYQTPSWNGVTDSQGRFYYQEGEQITFYLGGLILGSVAAQPIITPMDLMGKPSMTSSTEVLNVSRLLLSLDEDHDPGNGILIPDDVRLSLYGVSLNLSDPNLEQNPDLFEVLALLNGLDVYPEGITDLISAEDAQMHLEQIMSKIVTEGVDQEQNTQDAQKLHASIDIPYSYVFLAIGQSLSLSGSVHGGSEPYTYAWSIDNGYPFSLQEDPLSYTFETRGAYVLSFTVRDGSGRVSTDARLIAVLDPNRFQVGTGNTPAPLTSLFSASLGPRMRVGDVAEFQAIIRGSPPLCFGWTLGDMTRNFYDLAKASFNFILPGSIIIYQPIYFISRGAYPIKAVVMDAHGVMVSDTIDVTVE